MLIQITKGTKVHVLSMTGYILIQRYLNPD